MAHSCMPLLVTFAIFALACISVAHVIPTSIFIFGDSTADVGTNNHIEACTFKSDHHPYGMHYEDAVPTGRWSNGLHTIDYLCQKMLKYSKGSPKSFLELSEEEDPNFEHGVNFASAGSGLMSTTGYNKSVNSITVQLKQFMIVREKLASSMDEHDFNSTWIPNAIFLISVGSNDIMEYGANNQGRSEIEYAQILTDLYAHFIKDLYELGARKFGLIGVLKMGCCPELREEDGTCSSKYDCLSIEFTIRLKSRLQELQRKYEDFKYAFGNTGLMMQNAMSPYTKTGTLGILKVFNEACCKSCGDAKKAIVCENPDEYAFWDGHHPTQIASKLIADALYRGTEATFGKNFVSPITFKKLVEGDLEVDYVDDDDVA